MKAGLVLQIALAILFALVAGAPPSDRNVLEQRDPGKRALVEVTDIVTVTAPAVIVHVQGTRTWAVTNGGKVQPPTSSVEPAQLPSANYPGPANPMTVTLPSTQVTVTAFETVPSPTATSVVKPSSASTTSAVVFTTLRSSTQQSLVKSSATSAGSFAASTSVIGTARNGYGISYNPYRDDNSCKTADEVADDINTLSGYGMVRLYGTDCGQVTKVLSAVKQHPGMKAFLGVWLDQGVDVGKAVQDAKSIASAVNSILGGDWSIIDTVSVGNEVVAQGKGSVSQVLDALRSVKSVLSQYNVPVVTIEVPDVFFGSNPNGGSDGVQLCHESDYTAANSHAFFDTSGSWTDPAKAGNFVSMMRDMLMNSCGNRRTMISESGWPHGSDLPASAFAGNVARPNIKNHDRAIASLMKAFSGNPQDLVLFSAFDDKWKQDYDGTRGSEHYWGILNV